MKNNIIIFSILAIIIIGLLVILKQNSDNTKMQLSTDTTWVQYQNETPNFSFLYPQSMHLRKNDDVALVSVSAFESNNPQNASDTGIMGTLTIKFLETDNVELYTQQIEQNQFIEKFISSELILNNGVAIPTITYKNALGVHLQESFIDMKNGNILSISFVQNTEHSDVFSEILRSLEWKK